MVVVDSDSRDSRRIDRSLSRVKAVSRLGMRLLEQLIIERAAAHGRPEFRHVVDDGA
jgi:hypothetical protein